MSFAGKFATLGMMLFAMALEAAAAERGFYFGALGGLADYEFENWPVAPLVSTSPALGTLPPVIGLPPAFSIGAGVVFIPLSQWQERDDDRSDTWGILAGYRITRHVAVELNYLDLGKLKESEMFSSFPILTPVRFSDRSLETTGPAVSALGILPIGTAWSVYLRGGVFFAKTKLHSEYTGIRDFDITSDSDSLVWGLGTQYDFGAHWSVRADFQRFESVGELRETGRADVNVVTVGALFRL